MMKYDTSKRLFIKRLINVLKPYFKSELLGIIFTILYSIAVFGSPMVSAYLIDNVMQTSSKQKLYNGIMIFFIVCVSQPIFSYFKDILFLKITEKITLSIRKDMFSKVLHTKIHFFEKIKSGEIVSRIINDGRFSSGLISNIFIMLFKNIFIILIVIAGMFYLSVQLTSIILAMILTFYIVNWSLSKRFMELSDISQKNYDELCSSINNMSNSIVTIKSYNLEKSIEDNYDELLKRIYKNNIKIGYLLNLLNNLNNIITVVALCIIYGLGTLFVMQGKYTLGTVIALGLYFQLLSNPIYELMNNNYQINQNIPILGRIYEFLDLEKEFYEESFSNTINNNVQAKNLCFTYEDGVTAINNLNLEIKENGLYGIVGQSGSGKSTFVKLLLGFYRPSEGTLSIGGLDINTLPVNKIRENISFVSQDVELFNGTLMDNLKVVNQSISEDRIIDICKQVGIHDVINTFTDGYNTMLSEKVNLSGGEKQRLSIARAIIKGSKIMIFDEPTSALDINNELIIKKLLKVLSKSSVVIVIAHRLNTIIESDNIFVFDNGTVIENGKHEVLMKQEGVYCKLIKEITDSIKQGGKEFV